MNKQPYYHRAVILFTATSEVGRDALTAIICRALGSLPAAKLEETTILAGSVECEEVDAEPGSPADLV